MAGYLINNTTEIPSYHLGDTVEFIFKPDEDIIDTLDPILEVNIRDNFSNIFAKLEAIRIGDIYVAEYTIPVNLASRYNINEDDIANIQYVSEGYVTQSYVETMFKLDKDLFFLADEWILDDDTSISFPFNVFRKLDTIDESNCAIEIFIDEIEDSNGETTKKSLLLFSTKLTPYYATVQDVLDVNPGILSGLTVFSLARQIINSSRIVDCHLTPDTIYYQCAFDLAVKNYVSLTSAINLITPSVINTEEEKQIDTFKYRVKKSDPQTLLFPLQEQMRRFMLIILAGGKDTPFTSKTFQKGIFDPNRPNATRASFANIGVLPYLNTFTSAIVVNIDGSNIEVRGQRIIGYKYLTKQYSQLSLRDSRILPGQ